MKPAIVKREQLVAFDDVEVAEVVSALDETQPVVQLGETAGAAEAPAQSGGRAPEGAGTVAVAVAVHPSLPSSRRSSCCDGGAATGGAETNKHASR